MVSGGSSDTTEWNRDDPDYIAIRKVYANAKAAFEREDYRALFELIPPSKRIHQLCTLIALVRLWFVTWQPQPPDLTGLQAILERHKLPTQALPDPGNRRLPADQLREAWKLAVDLPGCFDEVAKWQRGLPELWALKRNAYAGELLVERIGIGRAQGHVHVQEYPKLSTGAPTAVEFVREGSEWYMLIPFDLPK